MARPRFRGVLLCEDQEHERFFRPLLYRRWFATGRLRVERIRNAEGAGDRFVLSRYAGEVELARRNKRENYAVVVVVDGDRAKREERLQQLDGQLASQGMARRAGDENVLVCAPTRSVETWELWLCGERDLDEDQDYKSRFRDAERKGTASAKAAVDAWFESLSPWDEEIERETLPALSEGRLEIRRLDGRGS